MSARVTVLRTALSAISALTALGALTVPPPARADHAGEATADAPADPIALSIGVGLGPDAAQSGPLRWEPLGWPQAAYRDIGVVKPEVRLDSREQLDSRKRLDSREHEAAYTGHGEPEQEAVPLPVDAPR